MRHRLVAPVPAIALLLLLLSLFAPPPVRAQADPTSRSWNQPVEPYRVIGNVYYVGASDISSFLITTPQGHILLDGGFEETVPIIESGIRKLGFRVEDVKILLNSHAHYDHAGGLAHLKRDTGAQMVGSEGDAERLAQGGHGDPVLGDTALFAPVVVDRQVRDGETVSLGGVTLTAHLTPGHTRGCTTWTMDAVDTDGAKRHVVFVGSATVLPDTRLVERPSYPGIAADYETTFRVLKALPCDVFLASHGSFYGAIEKAARLAGEKAKGKKGVNPFVDPAGYRAFVERKERDFREALAKERESRG